MRRRFLPAVPTTATTLTALTVLVGGALLAPAVPRALGAQQTAGYTVLQADGASRTAALTAIQAAGGRVTAENAAVRAFTVTAPSTGFLTRVAAAPALAGAVGQQPLGVVPRQRRTAVPERYTVEREHQRTAAGHRPGARAAAPATSPANGLDPLDDKLWGLTAIHADRARQRQPGDRRVLVGVIDTGIDGAHPDLAPNFDAKRSRNFTTDIPTGPDGKELDGPCEFTGCKDPANWDDGGHGTHVAGTIAAAANGFGLSGVAPGVSLVNLRAGQDSGYFFLGPVVDALTYAGDIGVDVVNMSFYVDPWYYVCPNNKADSPEARTAQRATLTAMNRALSYAHGKGVTLLAAYGNSHEDLGKPRTDLSSPNFPAGSAYPREIDNRSCRHLPSEHPDVLNVSATGPSGKKSDYSNYGLERATVAAPGGYFRDLHGTDRFSRNENLILSTAPTHVLRNEGLIAGPAGREEPTETGVKAGITRACPATGPCAFYQYLQGTSMATPHATGVAALIVSQYGGRDPRGRYGRWLPPALTELRLTASAVATACPSPRLVSYEKEGRPAEFDALCEGSKSFNGFYGHGVVDAYRAVTGRLS